MPEWFTISELRAAGTPGFSETFFNMLVDAYPALSSRQARARFYPGRELFYALEFNICLFTRAEQFLLAQASIPTGIDLRVLKLGLHRDVAAP